MCPGFIFASQMVKISLATILSRFFIEVARDARIDYHSRIMLSPYPGIPVTLRGTDRAPRAAPIKGRIRELVDLPQGIVATGFGGTMRGRFVGLSVPRRIVIETMRMTRGVPNVAIARRMNIGALVAARGNEAECDTVERNPRQGFRARRRGAAGIAARLHEVSVGAFLRISNQHRGRRGRARVRGRALPVSRDHQTSAPRGAPRNRPANPALCPRAPERD